MPEWARAGQEGDFADTEAGGTAAIAGAAALICLKKQQNPDMQLPVDKKQCALG